MCFSHRTVARTSERCEVGLEAQPLAGRDRPREGPGGRADRTQLPALPEPVEEPHVDRRVCSSRCAAQSASARPSGSGRISRPSETRSAVRQYASASNRGRQPGPHPAVGLGVGATRGRRAMLAARLGIGARTAPRWAGRVGRCRSGLAGRDEVSRRNAASRITEHLAWIAGSPRRSEIWLGGRNRLSSAISQGLLPVVARPRAVPRRTRGSCVPARRSRGRSRESARAAAGPAGAEEDDADHRATSGGQEVARRRLDRRPACPASHAVPHGGKEGRSARAGRAPEVPAPGAAADVRSPIPPLTGSGSAPRGPSARSRRGSRRSSRRFHSPSVS